MKVFFTICVLAFVALAYSAHPPLPTYPTDCYYDERGQCISECEEGTHSYTTGCGPLTPEPTCDQPNPVPQDGDICDYSDCYCNSPTVRDTVSKKCVRPEDCPKKESST